MDDGVKRKRGEDAGDQERAAKRVAHGSKEAYQREIAALYSAYDALHKALGSGQGREADFLTLLQAAQGSAAAQRLAARLLPKFARHFPAHVGGAAAALMGLAALSLNDGVSAGTRRDALGGLTPLVDAALSGNNVDVVMDVVRFALRQLQVQRGGAVGEGWVEVGSEDLAGGAVKCSAPDAAAAEALWRFLKVAFGALPRAVLAACLHLLRDPGNALHAIAKELLEDHILGPAPPAEVAAGDEAPWGGEPVALPPPTLAAAVLRSCAAKDAKWAAKTVQQFLVETPPEVAAAARPVLERLLQQLPPGTISPGLPPHSTGANGRSSRLPSGSVSPGPGAGPGSGRRPLREGSRERGQRSRTPDQQQQLRGSPVGRGAQQWSASERGGAAGGRRGGSGDVPRPPPHQDLLLDEGELPPEEAAAFFLPTPGGSVCLAAACLYLSALPRSATHQAIYAACGRNSPLCVVFPPQGPPDAAFVTFKSLRGAARCYEEMADGVVFPAGGREPVRAQFCSREAHPLDLPQPPDKPATHVWVGGASARADEDGVRRRLGERGVPEPEHVLKVEGRRPGLLLSFASHLAAEAAVPVLQQQQQQQRGRSASIAPTRSRVSPGPPLLRDQRRHSPPHFRQQQQQQQQSGRGGKDFPSQPPPLPPPQQRYPPPHASRPLPPPEYRSCCLWVGQVPGVHGEGEMMAAFRQFGIISSHKFMRKTAKPYAFVDFTTLEAATEARVHLDGAPVGGSRLVVEFKEEKHYNKNGPRQGGLRGGDIFEGGGGRYGDAAGRRGAAQPPQGYRNSPGPGVGREASFGGRGGGGGRDFRDDRGGERERDRDRGEEEPAHLRSRTRSPAGRRWEQGRPAAQAPSASHGPGWDRAAPHRTPAAAGPHPPDDLQRLYSVVSVELPPLPAAAAKATPQAPLLPPAAAAPAAPLGWRGSLAKSHQPQCKVVCTDPGGAWGGDVLGSWAAGEPEAWPESLDVQQRTDVDYVCATLFPSLPPSDRALRLVVAPPEDPGERPKLAGFAAYLRSKRRAGVVALPAARGAPARSLYLIPPTEESCRQLGLRWPPAQAECMVVLVARAVEAAA